MTFEEFEKIAAPAFPEPDAKQWEQFRQLEGLYEEWNAKINVISRKDIGGLYPHHILHSLSIATYLKKERPEIYRQFQEGSLEGEKLKVLDLGTGGGFPGVPLAILFPKVDFTLCDSVGKKTIVAEAVSKSVKLTNIKVVNARAETLDEHFDYVVSRAVTALDNFYPWVKGKFGQSILYLKGGDLSEEFAQLKKKYRISEKSIRQWQIRNWLEDEWFKDKMVIEISSK